MRECRCLHIFSDYLNDIKYVQKSRGRRVLGSSWLPAALNNNLNKLHIVLTGCFCLHAPRSSTLRSSSHCEDSEGARPASEITIVFPFSYLRVLHSTSCKCDCAECTCKSEENSVK